MLSRVAAELGSTAAITEVNKIRSGGVGGFFCHEEFEVIVGDKPEAKRPEFGDGKQPRGRFDLLENDPSDGLDASDARFRALLERRLAETSVAEADLAKQPLHRYLASDLVEPEISTDEAVGQPVAIVDLQTPVKAGHERPFVIQPPQPSSFDAMGFPDLKSFEPDTTTTATSTGPAINADPMLVLDTGQLERPEAPTLPFEAISMEQAASWLTPAPETSSFWIRLRQTRRELNASLPPDADVRAIVGPLALSTPIVRLLQCKQRLDPTDVVVLTSRAEIVSEPAWQLVRSSHEMVDAARLRAGRPTLLVIDVPAVLPVWVGPLLDRLRRLELGLVRYAVPGTPTVEQLSGYQDQASLPYVVDLVSRIPPSELSRIIDDGHPIATVAGIELNAELLMALREQVSLG